ncbi:MAG TPA: P1 family peptidase [Beutenbergiaceae bacterium]|nr:P1 family peptidase [Beutenbergiaceae bacterium]
MADRARGYGLYPRVGSTGAKNAITDVPGVRVGHTTIRTPPHRHTGVSAVRIGDVNPNAPLPAGLFAGNGYGKFIGATQIAELGQIEAPIVLTSTLSAFRAADAMVSWMLQRQDCAQVRSFNPVVGECNDGVLSDIRSRPVSAEHVHAALQNAAGGPVPEGGVGAGTGMMALGFPAGIGTSSRVAALGSTSVTLGVLVLANFGGVLRVGGRRVSPPRQLPGPADGSCIVVVVTDSPLDARQLTRVATRGVFALGRVGASYAHGSGDYGLAVSTRTGVGAPPEEELSQIFDATLDATEEAVLNALVAAEPVSVASGQVPVLREVLAGE